MEEKMDDETVYKRWGVIPVESAESSGFECPECNWYWHLSLNDLCSYIIGFDPQVPPDPRPIGTAGILYVKCPDCSTIFHFRVDNNYAFLLEQMGIELKTK